jgi:hypothetical protein
VVDVRGKNEPRGMGSWSEFWHGHAADCAQRAKRSRSAFGLIN